MTSGHLANYTTLTDVTLIVSPDAVTASSLGGKRSHGAPQSEQAGLAVGTLNLYSIIKVHDVLTHFLRRCGRCRCASLLP